MLKIETTAKGKFDSLYSKGEKTLEHYKNVKLFSLIFDRYENVCSNKFTETVCLHSLKNSALQSCNFSKLRCLSLAF